jgi:HK97 family phage major capsid protein
MSGAATLDPKAFEERLDRLNDQLNKIGSSIEKTHVNHELGAVAYFEDSDESYTGAQLKGFQKVDRPRRRLPKNYTERQFKSFGDFLRTGMRNQSDFAERYKKQADAVIKSFGLNTYEGENGASLVLPEFAPDIMQTEYTNDLFSRTNNFTVAGNTMVFPKVNGASREQGKRQGGIQGYWNGEETLLTKSNPQFDNITLRLKKLHVLVYATEELIDDNSYALEQWISRAVRSELDFMLGDSVFRGNGTSQPLGFLDAPGTIVVSKESNQSAATLVTDNILKMWSRRLATSRIEDLVWLINQEVEPQLAKLVLGTGGNSALVYMPPGGLSATPYATLQGRPVLPTEFSSALGTKGDVALVDFNRMLSISKGGVTQSISKEVEFLRDVTAYKFTVRVDARPMDATPITPYKGSNTQSAFVVLETRA